jgi:uncharacterized protein
VRNGIEPLDNSAVHPENYALVRNQIKQAGFELAEVIGNREKVTLIRQKVGSTIEEKLGKYTINDIFQELEKPGIDPRKKAKAVEFSSSIKLISDLKIGMRISGIVTNVTDFGAFVNIGIKENGLIHKTQLADEYVVHPTDYISLHDEVNAVVVSLDLERKRIGLSLKKSDFI